VCVEQSPGARSFHVAQRDGWAKARDDLIRQRGYKYSRPMFPFSVRTYAEELMAGENTIHSNDRRQFMRYLAKARSLASNAASGVFPGKY